ncbi:MAG: putative mycofactocin radical SAM maturase MftC [Firmicutes bacterium]|nr:MAG: radical SAM protein [Methanosarcinales archaeon Met12]MBT9131901.1 putative mycofactocin radical SAM maturase MftC [Bacillota bacterium]
MKFVAYNSILFKLILDYTGTGMRIKTKGLLSPFLGKVEKKFDEYLKSVPADIRGDKLYLSTAFPPVPSAPFKRLVFSQIKRAFGLHSPDNLTIMVTGECQCNCEHCLAHKMDEGVELSKNEIFDVIDQALELGVSQITFEGGEPTLRKDLTDLIEYIDKSKATSMIVTNGQHLSKDYVKKLKEHGADYINVSIDSPYREKHDEFRGVEGLFDCATEGIKNSVDVGILTGVLYIANPENCDRKSLERMADYCEELGVFELMIDKIVSGGKWAGKDVLGEEQEEEIIRFQKEVAEKKGKNFITNLFQLRRPGFFGCFAGRKWCYISPSGEVMPCMHTPISFGNVRKEKLSKIWSKIRKHPLFSKKPEKCAHEDSAYRERYLKNIPEDAVLPYPIEEFV